MFNISILETISIASTIMAAMMLSIFINEMFSQIDKSFIKLKEERKTLDHMVESLEKENEKLKCEKNNHIKKEVKTSLYSNDRITTEEINEILVNENRKLHVRCDMLEVELHKTRELNVSDKKILI